MADLTSAEWNDSSAVLTRLVSDVSHFFANEISILATWAESPGTICVIYRRPNDPKFVWGRRLQFPPHAVKDDPGSSGAAFAELLTEPAGTLFDDARLDRHGVMWLIPKHAALPAGPFWP